MYGFGTQRKVNFIFHILKPTQFIYLQHTSNFGKFLTISTFRPAFSSTQVVAGQKSKLQHRAFSTHFTIFIHPLKQTHTENKFIKSIEELHVHVSWTIFL